MKGIFGLTLVFVVVTSQLHPFLHRLDDVKDKSFGNGTDWYLWRNWMAGPKCPERIVGPLDVPASILQVPLGKIANIEQTELNQLHNLGYSVGFSTGIVYNGRQIYTNNLGTINVSASEPPTSDTIYDIGSITKIFTSLALEQAVNDGLASYDSTVDEFFNDRNPPAFHVKTPQGMESKITMGMLAAHISGLAREAPTPNYQQDYNITIIFENINAFGLLWPPNTRTHYSNLGITLIGRSLERIRNAKYEDIISQKILNPLGMSSSGFDFTSDVVSKMAIGYVIVDGKMVPSPTNNLPLGFSAPAGAMFSSVNDLSKFLTAIMSPENSDKNLGMSEENLRSYVNLGAWEMRDGISSIGKSTWETFYSNGYEVKTKAGLISGFGASIAYVPELKLGSVCLINIDSGSFGTGTTALHMDIMIPVITRYLKENPPVPKLPANVQDLLGEYKLQGYLIANVTMSQTPGYLHLNLLGIVSAEARWLSDVTSPLGMAFEYRNAVDGSCFGEMSVGEGIVYLTPSSILLPDFAYSATK